ncbi:MAG: ZIP family metal transporter [Candidatus Diapherotrites archaeon]|nr:ZIP family metal transporter [Candidatus Diapherotrites archaeon]
MLDAWTFTLASVVIVSLISFVGAFALYLNQARLHRILLYLVSFSTGSLLGDAFIHLLPESVETQGFGLEVSLYVLSGILVSFVIEKFIHWQHCHVLPSKNHAHPFALLNLYGDAVHNFIDGLIIAASYLVSFPLGVATTLAVVFHEIPQEIGDFGVLLHGGFTSRKALTFNFLTALTAVVGALMGLFLGSVSASVSFFLVPFAAGNFIYIAGADLIPELHKQTQPIESAFQILAVLLGIGVMVALLSLG